MNFKKRTMIILLVLSVFLLSSCEVYETLYGPVDGDDSANNVADTAEDVSTDDDSIMDSSGDSEDSGETDSIDLEKESFVKDDLSERCSMEPKTGPCKASFDKYYFDSEDGVCKEFIWGGCKGAVPFETFESCVNTCESSEVKEDVVEAEENLSMELDKDSDAKEAVEEETVDAARKEKPIVIVVEETEFISLVPTAEDPDEGSNLAFTYTSPLNDNGEWQTAYGDAGEYTVTVTASDGDLTTSRDVLIILNKKEESPRIDNSRPIESGLLIEETDSIDFAVIASDLNNDPLSFTWKFDGGTVGDQGEYNYQSTYEDAGTHTVKVDVSDGLTSASKIWSIEVTNVNRVPVLEFMDDITVKETDLVTITALATDGDRDSLQYEISDERFVAEDNVFSWQTGYDSSGIYEVSIKATDGQDTAQQDFILTVKNVNRPPVILDIMQRNN
jgi:hypothetical protein